MPNVHVSATFDLSSKDHEAINRIVETKHITKPEIYRRAIALYIISAEASEKHLNLALCNEAGIIKTKIVGY